MNSNVAYADFGAARRQERPTVADLDNGYTRIANEILDAVMIAGLTKHQLLIIMAVWRKTYGYNKKTDWIGNEQMELMIGIDKTKCSTAKNQLIRMKILIQEGRKVGINKNISEWNTDIDRNGKTFTETVKVSFTKTVKSTLPKRSNTKDNNTKDKKDNNPLKGGVRAPYIDAITGEDRTGFRMINKKAIIYSVVDGKVYQVAIPLRTGDAVLTDDLPKLPLIGSGSTRSGLTSSRELGVTYTNNRPYSIFVTVMLQSTARDSNLITRMRISDTPASNFYIGTRGNDTDILAEATHSQLVLPGERYVVTSSPNSKIVSWVEIAQ